MEVHHLVPAFKHRPPNSKGHHLHKILRLTCMNINRVFIFYEHFYNGVRGHDQIMWQMHSESKWSNYKYFIYPEAQPMNIDNTETENAHT
jgi:hypothetical protein